MMTDERQLRFTARGHIRRASLVAWLSSAVALIQWWILAVGFDAWALAGVVVVRVLIVSGLGWWLWTRESPTAAWWLGVLAAGGAAYSAAYTGSLLGAAAGVIVCLIYYRAWQGAEHLRAVSLGSTGTPIDIAGA